MVDYSWWAAVTFEADFLRSWANENGHTLIELNTHADGLFSAHSSDTLESENYEQLIKSVLGHGADIGIMFDGDADRLWVVTSSGTIIPGDLVYSLIIQQLHTTWKQIVFDAMSGNSIRRAIHNTNNIPVVCKMGRFFINEKIKQTGALIGWEISGHIMFSQAGGTECVLVATAYLLRSIETSWTLDDQLISLTQWIYREPMLNLHVEKKDEILAELVHHFQHLNPLTIDGVNIYTPTICLTARKSNTEPIIRIQLEASSKEEFNTIMNQVQDVIKKIEKQ